MRQEELEELSKKELEELSKKELEELRRRKFVWEVDDIEIVD